MPNTPESVKRSRNLSTDFAQRLMQGFGSRPGPESLAPTFNSMLESWGSRSGKTPIGLEFPSIVPPSLPDQGQVESFQNQFGNDWKPQAGAEQQQQDGGIPPWMLPLLLVLGPLIWNKSPGGSKLGKVPTVLDIIKKGIDIFGSLRGGMGGPSGARTPGFGDMLGQFRGDASFGHPSQLGINFPGFAMSPYEMVGPGIWDVPAAFMGQAMFNNRGGYNGTYSQ